MKCRVWLLFIFPFIFLLFQSKQIFSQSTIAEARREYNRALEEYNIAVKDYNETVALTSSNDFIMSMSKNKFAPFTRTVNRMTRSEAERKVEIAKQNLDIAKSKLISLESGTNYSGNSYNTSTSNTNNKNDSCSWGWGLACLACLLILLM